MQEEHNSMNSLAIKDIQNINCKINHFTNECGSIGYCKMPPPPKINGEPEIKPYILIIYVKYV